MDKKKILYLTGTRADFGKLKPLMLTHERDPAYEAHIFVTGMHMLSKFGYTVDEVKKCGFENIYTYINQKERASMDIILANTILGLSSYVKEYKIDMIVVHGDRVEPLAGAIVGALNNILVSHIEGGERSGTIDESLRHSISKLSHLHFVSNKSASQRLVQMGEKPESIFVIGSPDIDIMMSSDLPSPEAVKEHYGIPWDNYSLFIYHPVTSEVDSIDRNIREVIKALKDSGRRYIGIYPNNDTGNEILMEHYMELNEHPDFMIFPSIRFEYFLVLLKHCDFIIGNSSAGIREAEIYHRPTINIGTRQQNRLLAKSIINVPEDAGLILDAINSIDSVETENSYNFGNGKSAEKFHSIIADKRTWQISSQKYFVDLDF